MGKIIIPDYVTLEFQRQRTSSAFRVAPVAREVASCRRWFTESPVTCLATLARYIGGTYVHRSRNRNYLDTPMGLTQEHVQRAVDGWLLELPPDDFGAEEALEWIVRRLRVVHAAHEWGQKYQGHHPDEAKPSKGRIIRELASSVSLTAQRALKQLEEKRQALQALLPPAPAPTPPPMPTPKKRGRRGEDPDQMTLC